MQESLFQINPIGEFQIPPIVLWGVLGLFLVAFVIVSAMLIYHWRRYGMRNHSIILAEIIYLSVSGLLIFGAISALISY